MKTAMCPYCGGSGRISYLMPIGEILMTFYRPCSCTQKKPAAETPLELPQPRVVDGPGPLYFFLMILVICLLATLCFLLEGRC